MTGPKFQSISEAIRFYCGRAGINNLAFAKLMGKSPQYTSDIMGGRHRWTPALVNRACDALAINKRVRASLHRMGAKQDGWSL